MLFFSKTLHYFNNISSNFNNLILLSLNNPEIAMYLLKLPEVEALQSKTFLEQLKLLILSGETNKIVKEIYC